MIKTVSNNKTLLRITIIAAIWCHYILFVALWNGADELQFTEIDGQMDDSIGGRESCINLVIVSVNPV